MIEIAVARWDNIPDEEFAALDSDDEATCRVAIQAVRDAMHVETPDRGLLRGCLDAIRRRAGPLADAAAVKVGEGVGTAINVGIALAIARIPGIAPMATEILKHLGSDN